MANCCLVVTFSIWHIIGILAVIVANATSFWMSPDATGGLFFFSPTRAISHAGLWQTCVKEPPQIVGGATNATNGLPAGTGSALQDAEQGATAVYETIKDALPWANSTGCSLDVKTFYSNLEYQTSTTDPSTETTVSMWEIVIAERALTLAVIALSLVLIVVVASHSRERACSKTFAHVLAFTQFATSVTACVLWIVLLVRISKYDPTANSDVSTEWAQAREYLSNLDSNVEKGWENLNNYWGWSYWLFVGSAGWLFVGNFLICCM
ncbi:hypothetical protein PPROV_000960600 [Pycnococcus provasolii]|uniref:Uncharacterized protein n=1 Tax=Pycnococcus provasolii TaxID=41880 RepID=A0A830HTT0_9CHLO|nr:hypothetical protein PPROV_000960600 [Pycnococcus provasolii]|mmetsp:Transcript_91/g.305  ORF Transcript_91/g.305 Transcript_91/m.305 type:complete len:266 (-) Transcript_91:100-897(-)